MVLIIMKKIMFSRLLLTSVLFASASAFGVVAQAADGFQCQSVDGDIIIQVVLQPGIENDRLRRAATMIVSNPLVSKGHQAIARFRASESMLSSAGSVFVGHIDPRHPDTSRKGERIAGTTLGQLKTIILDIDFTHERPLHANQPLSGQAIFTKRAGQDLVQDFDCVFKIGR
jgi:hypothetical protein